MFLPDPIPVSLADWRAEMRDLGWSEGRDFIIIQSGIEHGSFIPDEAVQRIVATKPDLIFTGTTASALAANTQRRQFRS